jgi:hypothetical protein
MQRQQVSRADRSIELSNSHRAHPTEETRVAFLSRVFTARKRIKARQRKHGSPSFVLVLLRRHTPHADDENEKATARLRVKRRHLCACAREGSLWPSRCMLLPCRAMPRPGCAFICSGPCLYHPAVAYRFGCRDRPSSSVPFLASSSLSPEETWQLVGARTERSGRASCCSIGGRGSLSLCYCVWSPVSSSNSLFRLHSGMFRFIQHRLIA